MAVIFVVLNVLMVWPHFGDWSLVRADLEKARNDLFKYEKKIAQAKGPNGYEAQLKRLEGEGEAVVAEQQDIQLFRTVQSKVTENKVSVSDYGKITQTSGSQSTNEFFEEQSISIGVNTGEKELVDFLLDVGAGSSMIRVRDLDLKPADQNRYRLQGRVTLSANYQKKPAVKPAAPVAKPAATAAAKPAAPSPAKPAVSPAAAKPNQPAKPAPSTVKKT